MELKEELTYKKPRNTPFLLLIFSIIFSFYYIEIGFALKPYMILSLLFFLLSLKTFVIHYLKTFEVALLLFFGYYCLTGFFAKYPMYSLRLIFGIFLILFCYFVMRYILSIASLRGIEKGLSIGGLVFNVLSLGLYLVGIMALNFVLVGNRITSYGVLMDRGFPRLTGLTSDPNIFVFYNLIFFFYYVTHTDRKWSKIGLVLTTTTIMLSMSRGGILAIAVGLLFMFITSKSRRKIKLMFILPISTIILNFILKATVNIDVLSMTTDRFLANDGGSGRSGIWSMGLYFFQENPIFGIGIFNYKAYSEARYGFEPYMHNTYLEALVEGGIVGLALYLLIFLTVIITYYNHRKIIKDKGYLLFTFLAMAVLMATYSFMVNEIFFFVLALIWRYLHEIKLNRLNIQYQDSEDGSEVTKKTKRKKKYRLVW